MKNKRNSFVLAVLVLALIGGFLAVPVRTQAQTASAASQPQVTALTDQLNSLLRQLITLLTTQLQQLQAQLTAKQGQEQTVAASPAAATSTAAASSSPNKLPRVNVVYPGTGLELKAGASTDFIASAADDDGTISKVEFFASGSLLGTATGKPYQTYWNNIPAGTYSLTARATDNGGAQTTSAPVELKVQNPGDKGVSSPTITISIVPANIYVASGTSATITATTDSIGGWIDKVIFSRAASTTADAAFQTDVTPPWSGSSTFTAIGLHTISAIATNNVGATTRSASTTISVQP